MYLNYAFKNYSEKRVYFSDCHWGSMAKKVMDPAAACRGGSEVEVRGLASTAAYSQVCGFGVCLFCN